MPFSRRTCLIAGSSAFLAGITKSLLASPTAPRRLQLEHLRTGEKLDIIYRTSKGYDRAALRELTYLMRDWRTGEIKTIHPALFDYLFEVQSQLGQVRTINVISGYRSRATNEALRRRNPGVAKRSLHIAGRAIDITIPGISTRELSAAAFSLKLGGVGTYTKSGFVHLDTGRVRHWGS